MKITLQTADCRFKQIGDWPEYDDIRCLPLGNWQYEALVLIHELVESLDCKRLGIKPEDVDKFDIAFNGDGEPGDVTDCPYRSSHQLATVIEMMIATHWGISFSDYLRITNHIGAVYHGTNE